MIINPVGLRLLVEFIEPVAKSVGGIILPSAEKKSQVVGTILDLSEQVCELEIYRGSDRVLFNRYDMIATPIENQYLVNHEAILAIIKDKE